MEKENSEKELLSSILNDNVIIIGMISILSLSGIYFYELGVCFYFDIPKEIITIDIKKYSSLIFLIIGLSLLAFYLLTMFSMLYLKIKSLFTKKKEDKDEFISNDVIILFGFSTLFITNTDYVFVFMILVYLVGEIVIWQSKKRDLFGMVKTNFKNPYFKIGLFFKSLSFISIISFYTGLLLSTVQTKFHKRNDNSVLIRNYGEINVYGKIISNEYMEKVKFIYYEPFGDKRDSLEIYHLKMYNTPIK